MSLRLVDSAPKRYQNAGLRKDFKSKSKKLPKDIDPFQSGGLDDEDAISVRPAFPPPSPPSRTRTSRSLPPAAPLTYPENLQCDLSRKNNVCTLFHALLKFHL
jgi:hypothetical protein